MYRHGKVCSITQYLDSQIQPLFIGNLLFLYISRLCILSQAISNYRPRDHDVGLLGVVSHAEALFTGAGPNQTAVISCLLPLHTLLYSSPNDLQTEDLSLW